MRTVKFIITLLIVASLAACSAFGKGGKGSSGDYDADGNIPLAEGEGILKDVNFAYDSAALDETARNKLKMNASWLQENTDAKVTVEGHCDERGTAEYNLALGERRARSVFDFLQSSGVAATRIKTISYGEELPLDPAGSETAWSKNRRAHFAMN